jgi:hypothetical protein
MEILIYALSASYAARSQKQCVVAKPEEFQPFDLQALRNSPDNKPSRPSSRREAFGSAAPNIEVPSTMPRKLSWKLSIAGNPGKLIIRTK